MVLMGRKRKHDLGLEPRLYARNGGTFWYAHRDRPWENLGTDREKANARARLYNDPSNNFGTMVYWLDMFLADCERRVALRSEIKGVKLSQRTLEDYRDAIGTDDKPGALRACFPPPRTPLDVTVDAVQAMLRAGAENGRPRRSNLERAALSACFGWLLREKKVEGLQVNPCLRGSGVQRNPETKRERYVTDAEYADVWGCAGRAERLLMALTYRTLQRPESDIIRWDSRVVTGDVSGRFLKFRQYKTQRTMVIRFSDELDALIPRPEGTVRQLVQPLVATLKGGFYTYDGLSSMLKRAIKAANKKRAKDGHPLIQSFGYRDLKGKGATDMWLAGEPIEKIQALCGHASKATTEQYVKQRYFEAAEPNKVAMK